MTVRTVRREQGCAARRLVVLVALLATVLPGVPAVAVQTVHTTVTHEVPVAWTPHALDGRVNAIVEVGDRVYVGGSFTSFRSHDDPTPVTGQPYLFAFDARTGAIDRGFAPLLDGEVETLAASSDGRSLFVGGYFDTVDGAPHAHLVKLSTTDGTITGGFSAAPDRPLRDLVVSHGRVYLGGYFTRIGASPRTAFAAVDEDTGAVLADVDLTFGSPYQGRDEQGALAVYKLDVSPDGTRAVAIGNFGTVAGLVRENIVVLDVAATPARVADWATDRFGQRDCAGAFDSYLRDVDIAPDGSYFVVVTTGAYRQDRLCDTASRWELGATGGSLEPTWVNYTGGDTLHGVGITGEAVYIGGHQRWVNNDWAGDAAGPGAVARDGLAALDPRNGMPLTWNPGRTRGVGVFDIVGVDDGLYIGHDTDQVRWEYHGRLAKFPTAGWSAFAIPPAGQAPLVGDVFHVPASDDPRDPAFLYRVNAGGGALPASDAGSDWEDDSDDDVSPYRNTTNRAVARDGVATVDAQVPASTPLHVYATERRDGDGGQHQHWAFPVDAGREVEVRLYLANQCRCDDSPGEQVFDIVVDGAVVVDDLDLAATVGSGVGTMRSATVTSDGTVDIELVNEVGATGVYAIEIVDPALLGQPVPTTATTPERRPFDGASVTSSAPVPGGLDDWSRTRGAFMLSGRLYAGQADGTLLRWAFDGSAYTAASVVDLRGLTSREFPLASVTGMSFDHVTGRLYYTVAGDPVLHYRYFGPQAEVVGARQFDDPLTIDGLDWASVRGLHLEGDHVVVGGPDGTLRRYDRADGTVEILSGPSVDGHSWDGLALFTYAEAGHRPANIAPVAAIGAACDGVDCTFGVTGSHDPDGRIETWSWDLDEGVTATGPRAERRFTRDGPVRVGLTVGDDRGGMGTATLDLVLDAAPTARIDVTCDGLDCTFDGSSSSDVAEPVVGYAWDLGDGTSATGAVAGHTFAAAGRYDVTLTVTDDEGTTGTATLPVDVRDAAGAIGFVGASVSNQHQSNHEVAVPAGVVAGDLLVLAVSVNSTAVTLPAIDGWVTEDTVTAGTLRTRFYSRVAERSDAGTTVTVGLSDAAKTDVVLAAYEGVRRVDPITVVGAAETDVTAAHTTPVVEAPADALVLSYWADKTSGTTTWTLPDGVVARHVGIGTGGGRVTAVLADGAPTVAAGPVGGLTATADSANAKATMWTLVLNPRDLNLPPVADLAATCDDLTCTLDASGSSDGDGAIVAYDWDLGDGTVASGAVVGHTYATAGTYPVTVTVTDDAGASATASTTVTTTTPAADISYVGGAGVNDAGTALGVVVPSAVQAGDLLVLTASVNSTGVTLSDVGGWTQHPVVTSGTLQTRVHTRLATAEDAGSTVSVAWSGWAKADVALHAYRGVALADPVDVVGHGETAVTATHVTPVAEAPDGAWVVSYWTDKTSSTTGWVVADGLSQRHLGVGQGGGRVTAVLADTGGPVVAGAVGGAAATADSANAKATMWTLVLKPAGFDPAPVASFDVTCDGPVCALDATPSFDPDGSIVSFAWDLGDGGLADGASVEHTYAGPGTYTVTLTVTDDDGLVTRTTRTVEVASATAPIRFVGATGVNQTWDSHDVAVPATVAADDLLVLFVSANATDVAIGDLPGWTAHGTVVAGSMQTRAFTRVAAATDAGSTVTVTLTGAAKTDVVLAAYAGVDPAAAVEVLGEAETVRTAAHRTPATTATDGALVVSYWADKTSATSAWTVPAGTVDRYTGIGVGGGRITAVLADSGDSVSAGPAGGLTATADSANAKATMWTVVLTPLGA